MKDGTGHAEMMLGLDGVKVLDVEERPGELVVTAETTRTRAYCPSCRKRAKPHDRSRSPSTRRRLLQRLSCDLVPEHLFAPDVAARRCL